MRERLRAVVQQLLLGMVFLCTAALHAAGKTSEVLNILFMVAFCKAPVNRPQQAAYAAPAPTAATAC